MTRARRMLRIAAVLLMLLGVGHLVVMVLVAAPRMAEWIGAPWAAVPLFSPGDPTVESLRNALAFWGGYGSFGVPMTLLGALLWWGAGREIVPPVWVGWVLVAWFAVGAVLLGPSPMVVGVVAGVLLVIAARLARRRDG